MAQAQYPSDLYACETCSTMRAFVRAPGVRRNEGPRSWVQWCNGCGRSTTHHAVAYDHERHEFIIVIGEKREHGEATRQATTD